MFQQPQPASQPFAKPPCAESCPDHLAWFACHTDHAVVLMDVQGRVEWVNDGFARLTEHSLEDVRGKRLEAFLSGPQSDPRTAGALQEGRAEGVACKFEFEGLTKSGQPYWASLEAQPVRSATGRVTHYVTLLSDLSELRRAREELRESRRAFSTLLGILPGLAYRGRNDRARTMETVSAGGLELTGYGCEDLIASRRVAYGDLIHPEDRGNAWDALQSAVAERRAFELTYRILTAWGREKVVSDRGQALYHADGSVAALEGFITDVTERQESGELAYERDLLQILMDNVPVRIFFKDRATRFLRINRFLAQQFGLADPAEAVGRTDSDFYPEEMAREFREDDLTVLRTGSPLAGKEERISLPREPEKWALVTKVPFRDREGRVIGIVGVSKDITELKNMERWLSDANGQLQDLARADALTGLMNRRVILEAAETEWVRWRRYGGAFATLILDADDFKLVNDRHGHVVGDHVLQHLASRLLRGLRNVDAVGRYGGEEFMVLLPETGLDGAIVAAQKILRSIGETPIKTDGLSLPLTVSIGAAAVREDDASLDVLIQRADRALYVAKRGGKNQACADPARESLLFT
jgi:diguanylate cyclase (GGDEF)-like protein/PAS domain S-box-containing protein